MKNLFITLVLVFSISAYYAHGGEDHSKPKTEHNDGNNHSHESTANFEKASFNDFPTLHPLVVHFPVVLLLFALLFQIASLFVFKDALSWVTMALAFGGLLGAYIAGEFVHPHLGDISDKAAWALEQHETFADYTLYAAFVGFILKVSSHFFLKKAKWVEILTLLFLFGAAYSVSEAGHYGAQLTHIEDVEVETKAHSH